MYVWCVAAVVYVGCNNNPSEIDLVSNLPEEVAQVDQYGVIGLGWGVVTRGAHAQLGCRGLRALGLE